MRPATHRCLCPDSGQLPCRAGRPVSEGLSQSRHRNHGGHRWRPVIDRQLGREVMGVVQGGSESWQLARQRGISL
ncbi:DUF3363 domain-containing protein [Pseudomonas aeruginosa]|nr:DUF3363 domain-containing protein [Pseudomonas juntendi]